MDARVDYSLYFVDPTTISWSNKNRGLNLLLKQGNSTFTSVFYKILMNV